MFDPDCQRESTTPRLGNNAEEAVILARMAQRRQEAATTQKMDDDKYALCEAVRLWRTAQPGLSNTIRDLRDSDPILHQYITELEQLRYGIWCHTCEKPKRSHLLDMAREIPMPIFLCDILKEGALQ